MKITLNRKWLTKFVSTVFPILMILSNYMVLGTNNTSLGMTLLSMIMVVLLFYSRKIKEKTSISRLLSIIALYLVIDQLIVMLRFDNFPYAANIRHLIFTIFAILSILYLPGFLDYTRFYKVFFWITLIACIGIIFQSIQVYVLRGTTRMIVLPGMHSWLSPATQAYIERPYNIVRPSSIFSEPSAFATFTIPMIILAIREKQYPFVIFISICNLLTTSSTGILFTAAVWSYWIFIQSEKNYIKVFAVLFFAAGGFLFLYSSAFTFATNKIATISTSNERLFSGLTIFSQMPLLDKITGVGLENVSNYIKSQHIDMSSVFVTAEGYVTTAFGNMVKAGIIQGILYFVLCFKMIIDTRGLTKLVAILILIMSFIQTVAFNMSGVWWFVVFEIMRRNDLVTIQQRNTRKIRMEKVWGSNYNESIAH